MATHDPQLHPDSIRVVAVEHPLTSQRAFFDLEPGLSLREIAQRVGFGTVPTSQLRFVIDDLPIPRRSGDLWPEPGSFVSVIAQPGTDPISAAISSFIIKATGATGLAATAIKVGVYVAVSLATHLIINALSRPDDGGDGIDQRSSPTLSGARNQLARGVIWRHFGTHRIKPFFLNPVTEVVGDDHYLRLLFVPGFGPLELPEDQFRIGKTALSDYDDVETEVRQGFPGAPPITLYSSQIEEEGVGVKLQDNQTTLGVQAAIGGPWHTRTTDIAVDQIGVDVRFLRGLSRRNNRGTVGFGWRWFELQFRLTGSGDPWEDVSSIKGTPAGVQRIPAGQGSPRIGGLAIHDTWEIVRQTDTPFSIGFTWDVASGQYDVRVRSTFSAVASGVENDEAIWVVLRSIRSEDPIKLDGLAKIALRIKATDQLSGTIESFNCLARAMLPAYDPTHPTADAEGITAPLVEFGGNPAWAALEVLRGSSNSRPVPLSRVDLTKLQSWAAFCEAENWRYDAVHDVERRRIESLRQIMSAGRGFFTQIDGKYSVAIDEKKPVASMHVSPRNTAGTGGQRDFVDLPHAVKLPFLNEEKEYEPDELVVYDDGFSEDGAGGTTVASKFEVIRVPGQTNPARLWRHGRFHIAQGRLRSERVEREMDWEYLTAQVGDRVELVDDVMKVGVGYGRIQTVNTSGTDVVSVVLDEEIQYEAAKTYSARLQLSASSPPGATALQGITNPATPGTLVTFSTPIPNTEDQPVVGDQVYVVETVIGTFPMLLKRIEPLDGVRAKLVLIPYAEAVYDSDTGPIPELESQISHDKFDAPPVPTLGNAVVAGDRLLVEISIPTSKTGIEAAHVQIQWREHPIPPELPGEWTVEPLLPGTADHVRIGPLVDGSRYDVRARSLSPGGVFSAFVTKTEVSFNSAEVPTPTFKVTGLQLLGQGNDTDFEGRDAHFTWRLNAPDGIPDPIAQPGGDDLPFDSRSSYLVRIVDLAGADEIVREDSVRNPEYTYTIEKQRADAARRGKTILRQFQIQVGYRHRGALG